MRLGQPQERQVEGLCQADALFGSDEAIHSLWLDSAEHNAARPVDEPLLLQLGVPADVGVDERLEVVRLEADDDDVGCGAERLPMRARFRVVFRVGVPDVVSDSAVDQPDAHQVGVGILWLVEDVLFEENPIKKVVSVLSCSS